MLSLLILRKIYRESAIRHKTTVENRIHFKEIFIKQHYLHDIFCSFFLLLKMYSKRESRDLTRVLIYIGKVFRAF